MGIIPGTEQSRVREAVVGRAERFEGAEFRTSSYSQPSDSCCAEVALGGAAVGVRDSKAPGGPVVAFGRESWVRFIDGLTGR